MTRLTLQIPESAFATMHQAPHEFALEMRVAAAVKWYELERVSQGRAAEIAGLTRAAFIDALSRYKVSPFQYTAVELAAQNRPIRENVLPPDVPTLDEAGLKGFDADSVFGFYAPAGTPPAVIAKLNTEINRILATTAVKDKIAALGGEALPLSPAEFGAKALEDSKRFGTLIKERNIVGD